MDARDLLILEKCTGKVYVIHGSSNGSFGFWIHIRLHAGDAVVGHLLGEVL